MGIEGTQAEQQVHATIRALQTSTLLDKSFAEILPPECQTKREIDTYRRVSYIVSNGSSEITVLITEYSPAPSTFVLPDIVHSCLQMRRTHLTFSAAAKIPNAIWNVQPLSGTLSIVASPLEPIIDSDNQTTSISGRHSVTTTTLVIIFHFHIRSL